MIYLSSDGADEIIVQKIVRVVRNVISGKKVLIIS